MRILVVDDNLVNQKVATVILQKLGCQINVATTGQKAIELINREIYDLVFMDCQMPEMDGYEATKEIRKQENDKKDTLIVAMTANAGEEDRDRCLAVGMNDYISKPIRLTSVKEMLEKWINTNHVKKNDPITNHEKMNLSKIDFSVLEDLRSMEIEDEPNIVNKLINIFLEDTSLHLVNMKKAFQDHDYITLRKIGHTLKGSSANLGAIGMVELANKLEYIQEQYNPTDISNLMAQLEQEFQGVHVILDSEAKKQFA